MRGNAIRTAGVVAAVVAAFGAGIGAHAWMSGAGSQASAEERESDARCAEVHQAVEEAADRAVVAKSDAVEFANSHQMVPAYFTTFPDLWSAQAASPDDRAAWDLLLADFRLALPVPLRLVDDSPECFSPTEVATIREMLDQYHQ